MSLHNSAGMRCASGVALFNSLGLVSGGLRKQAATFFQTRDGVLEWWSGGVVERWSAGVVE